MKLAIIILIQFGAQLACKSERECRAVEICEMMTNQLTIQLAIKYATRLHMLQLAERLNELSRQRALDNETADSDDESNTEHTYHPAPVKSLNRLQRSGRQVHYIIRFICLILNNGCIKISCTTETCLKCEM